jgi:F0F1-type ATP synthase assembly protein I
VPVSEQPGSDKRKGLFGAVGESGPLLTSGLQLGISVIAMALLGWWLDNRWNTTPWLTLAGVLFGAGAGLYQFIKTANTISKEEEKKEQIHR